MIQLVTSKYRNTYSNNYYYSGSSNPLGCGDNGVYLQNGEIYFRMPTPIYHADLPLHLNGIKFERYYFTHLPEAEGHRDEVIEEIKNKLLNLFNDASNTDDCIFVTGFLGGTTLENPETNYDFIDTDLWIELKDDAIKSLFNKCAEQTSLRESERQGRGIRQHIRIFKSKTKHILLMLTDYADIDQESETLLALGLVPILYEDFKQKFEPTEIEYFKALVNRSQVKRISNVKVAECFKHLEALEKYKEIEREIRYKTMFNRMAELRIATVENSARQYRRNAEAALRNYDEALKKINEFDIIIEKYKEGKSDIIDELKLISKTTGVYDINPSDNGNGVYIVLRVPLDYYDADEAECAIRSMHDDNVVRFINEVFLEQKYKLYIRCDIYYDYSGADNFRDFGEIYENNCIDINAMFNPHFQFYHCLGNYKPSLIKAMRDQDLTMFVNIALTAARSMNFKDGAVCSRWFSWLKTAFDNDAYLNMRCLEKDGHLYTLKQWLTNDFEEHEEIIVERFRSIEPRDI